MIIEYWLDQSVPMIFGLLTLALALTGAASLALFESRWTRGWVAASSGVVAPFFTAVAVLFSLLTGFAANDAWERVRQANRAVLAERDGLVALYDVSLAASPDMAPIRATVIRYLEAVMVDEWPLMRDGRTAPSATAAFSELLAELAKPSLSASAGLAVHETLLASWQKVRAARSDRVVLSEQFSDHPKWWTIFVLAVLTQVALALVHIGKPIPAAVAISLFTVAAVVTLSLVAVKERPFDGPLATPPTALAEALAELRKN
ncbi:DUF4239 domain-containing protein [Enterovirga rhinocerotis]|uniref:Uncharacterized protein DUF4239 n=1 Tax=Enterovirga rhinocerotis TaxID=1339210 RepID=A0A4V3DYS9_9HYPH|nr:DUF4239 domain-containing protein [Enterovirga rhinocerotis]TDR93839.1 uncharacterized protein DUF4239 [Enterovirga rhinocerotis]